MGGSILKKEIGGNGSGTPSRVLYVRNNNPKNT